MPVIVVKSAAEAAKHIADTVATNVTVPETAAVLAGVSQVFMLDAEGEQHVKEYVRLRHELESYDKQKDACEVHKKAILALATQILPNDEQATVTCKYGTVTVTPAPDQREITEMNALLQELKAKVGYETMISLLKVTLSDMDKYLGEAVVEKFAKHKPGPRKIAGYTHTPPNAL